MKINSNSHSKYFKAIILAAIVIFSLAQTGFTQIVPTKVGRFWSIVVDPGHAGYGSISAGYFPADYNVEGYYSYKASITGGGTFFQTDFRDTIAYAGIAPATVENPSGTVINTATGYLRHEFPTSTVNFEDISGSPFTNTKVDPSKMIGNADQVVTNEFEYLNGVRAKQTVMAWSADDYNDYILTDIIYTNTSDDTIKNLYIAMGQGNSGLNFANGHNPSPEIAPKDEVCWYHYYGARIAEGDSQRIAYRYSADDPRLDGDDMGAPAIEQGGRLLRGDTQFWGFLHVSKQPFVDQSNDVDDPLQPKITYAGGVIGLTEEGLSKPRSYELAAGKIAKLQPMDGIESGTYHRMNTDEAGSNDYTSLGYGLDYSPFAQSQHCVVPYDAFPPGTSIRIVYVSGAAGLDLKMEKRVGEEWANKTLEAPPNLPDTQKGYFPEEFVFPDNATQWDINKDLWISTSIDSVHKVMARAKWNFEHNYQAGPATPPPPSSVDVTGYPNKTEIKWSDPDAEALNNFAGYRIRRMISRLDTTFFKTIKVIPPDDKSAEHVYEDADVTFGASYFYYVQSAVKVPENDMTALPEMRGKKIWSNRLWIPTTQEMEPPRGGTESLSDIRIAPNPYNINDPLLDGYGWTDFRGILFFNLPSKVTIKIYTENGDLVDVINHDSPLNAGSLRWDMITKNEQVISTGVYIAVFQKDNGEVSYQKFGVVR